MSEDWKFLIALSERLRPLTRATEIPEVAVRLVGEYLTASRVNYSTVDTDEFRIIQSFTNDVSQLPVCGPVAYLGQAVVAACRRGETVSVNDVRTDSRLTDAERTQLLSNHTAAFIVAPIIKGSRWIGKFGVHSATPRAWTRDQVAVVEMAAELTWGADERARAENALSSSEDRQAFLRSLNDTIRPLADPARILHETSRLLGTYLRVNRVAYGEIDGDDCVITGDYVDGLPSTVGRIRWRTLGSSRMPEILQGGTLVVNDTSAGPHTPDERAALQAAGIGAYICPLLIKDGRFVSAFGIHSRMPRVWTREEIALAQDVADRIWATLEHRRAEAVLRANEARSRFLLRLNDALQFLSDPAAVQETAARLLGEHLGAARVGYAELTGREYAIRREHTRGVAPLVGQPSGIVIGSELRDALRRGETVVVADVRTDPRLGPDERATLQTRQIAAFIGVGLVKEGQFVAAFGANHDAPRPWTPQEAQLVRDVAERTWDAVERTRAEARLRAQEQRLRLAVDASAGGSWTWVAATNEVDWDDRFRALYGLAPDLPANIDAWLPIVHEDDRPRVLGLVQEMMTSTTKDSWESTFRIVRPDGTEGWVQSRGRAERDANGGLVRLTGLDLDFTRYHRAEQASQARRDEEHDRALRTLLETATQGIVSVDAHGTIVTVNRGCETMFGWPAEALVGEAIERLMPSPIRDTPDGDGETPRVGIRRDGSTFPIEVSVTHVPTPSGGRTFAFVTDITERERAAAALRERTAELEHRTTQLRQMASDLMLTEQRAREQIAKTLHDGLQQLLVIVALNLDQELKRAGGTDAAPNERLAEAKYHIDEAIAAARSLNLELFPPVLQQSGLPAALGWLARWTRDKYKLAVQFTGDPRADSPRKDVRTLLFESVRELLFNAVKHAQADRITLELSIDDRDQLCITVADQGVGFEPARLDERSKSAQVGWGLFSIRERLSLLGGGFDIESAIGRGTRVRLVVPRGRAEDNTAADSVRDIPPIVQPGNGRDRALAPSDALRILIVDDHAAVRNALREILHQRPQLLVVGDASNGFEAIAHARALQPDVILMDIGMPHMDGVEATARIRAELPSVQVLGVSMHGQSETAQAIERAGAAGFFIKGIDTQRLIDRLLVLHGSRADRNLRR